MEGIAFASSIDTLLATFGISGTFVIMCIIAFFVVREVKKANEATQKAVSALKTSTEKKIDDLKEHSDKKDEALVARLEKAENYFFNCFEVRCHKATSNNSNNN